MANIIPTNHAHMRRPINVPYFSFFRLLWWGACNTMDSAWLLWVWTLEQSPWWRL